MNLLSLEYFIAIARYGSISKAANELYVSQQTLSEHLGKLERELHVSLFERKRPLELTHAGRRLLDGAREIVQARDIMVQDVNNISNHTAGKVFIGITSSYVPPLLSQLLTNFATNYSHYKIILSHVTAEEVMNSADINIFFADSAFIVNTSVVVEILNPNERYAVAIHKALWKKTYGDIWPSVEKTLLDTQDLSVLTGLPFIMPRDRNGQNSPTLVNAFKQAGFRPTLRYYSEIENVNTEICASGCGAYLGPESVCHSKFERYLAQSNDLKIYPVRQPQHAPSILFGYKQNKRLSEAEMNFINMVQLHTTAY